MFLWEKGKPLNYHELVGVVARILMKPDQQPLSFGELKKIVEEKGPVDDDRILEQVLVEMRGRKTVSYDTTTKGNLTNIRWN